MFPRLRLLLLSLLVPLAPIAAQEEAPQSIGSAASVRPSLAGTAWQLVRILSMDDSVYEPRDRSLYRLEFQQDGRASLLADCNRGTGSWTEAAGKLEFGPVASTRAMCPPGSISERYL